MMLIHLKSLVKRSDLVTGQSLLVTILRFVQEKKKQYNTRKINRNAFDEMKKKMIISASKSKHN